RALARGEAPRRPHDETAVGRHVRVEDEPRRLGREDDSLAGPVVEDAAGRAEQVEERRRVLEPDLVELPARVDLTVPDEELKEDLVGASQLDLLGRALLDER